MALPQDNADAMLQDDVMLQSAARRVWLPVSVTRLAASPAVRHGAVVAALAVLALLYRLLLLRTTMAPVDSDQAVAGLMARHIMAGDRPVFFYGQAYNGAQEGYLTALVFRLWGVHDLTLRLVPAVLSALFVVQVYGLGRRLYGAAIALAGGLWLALPPAVLAFWGTAAGAGYIEPVVLGTGLCLIAVRRWGLDQPRRYDLPALGLLAGLGLWAQPMIADYLLALALASAPRIWHNRGRLIRGVLRPGLTVSLGGAVGAAPWLQFTLSHLHASFLVLTAPSLPWSPADLLRRIVTEAMPVLLGGAIPTGYPADFARYVAAHVLPYALTLAAGSYIAIRLLLSSRGLIAQGRALLRGRPRPDAVLATLLVSIVALYLASRFKTLTWTTRNPRYLLPLYTCTPYLLACLPISRITAMSHRARTLAMRRWARTVAVQRWARTVTVRRWARALRSYTLSLVLAVALLINVDGGVHYADLPSTSMPAVTPLVARLLARGDTAVYADYWVVWRLAFASGERLAVVPLVGLSVDLNPRGDRYPPSLARAARASRWAYILSWRDVPAFVALLRRYGVPYRHWRWGSTALFYNHWDWGSPVIFDGPVRGGFPFSRVGFHR